MTANNEMNPPINELRPGDWVCIANGDWFQIQESVFSRNLMIGYGNKRLCVYQQDHGLESLITDTRRFTDDRGDTPPPADREMLDELEKRVIGDRDWDRTVYLNYDAIKRQLSVDLVYHGDTLRDAIRADMKEGNDDE